jgi:glycosyltransferase involved in cell wall biosynthesis
MVRPQREAAPAVTMRNFRTVTMVNRVARALSSHDIVDGSAVMHAGLARRKPRVVMIQTQAEGAGAQEISRILGQGFEARGYEVHHVFFFRRTSAFDNEPNAFFCALQRPGGIPAFVRMLTVLIRHLRQLRPDVVLCFQHYGNIVGALAARIAGAKVIIANRTSAKVLEPRWTRWLDLAFGTTGLFKKVVVNSKEIEDEYRRYPRLYQARVARIDHGFQSKSTDLNRSAARRALALPENITLLGSVARLHPLKNLDAAIRLLVIHQDWHLALAGQGPAQPQLESLAKSLGVLDRLHFMGELSPAQIGIFLRTLDVFVFPSQAESFGLAAVEAAQAGIPVVANDLGVLREVLAIDELPCALFVDAANPESFAAAVQKFLDDDVLKATLTSRGRQLSQRYSPDAMVVNYLALIETGAVRSAGRS